MRYAGIDIGSRTIKFVVVQNGEILETRKTDTGFDPVSNSAKLLNGVFYDKILATGYGRNLFGTDFNNTDTITEIKAHARGVLFYFKNAETILDIGGQDSKAIGLNKKGRVRKFEMNDRCAAGTGKFMEVMAKNLGFEIDQFGSAALKATKNLSINSMCTVFAESEVTSMIARGADRGEIARGLHLSIVKRAAGMINRVSSCGPVIFSGGVAKNICIRELLSNLLDREVYSPENPEMTGALGAALIAEDRNGKSTAGAVS